MQESHQLSTTTQVEGVVLGTSENFVWIDLGADHLAVASAYEFGEASRNQKVKVYVIGSDPEELYLVSKSAPKPQRERQDLKNAAAKKTVITGRVEAFVKGGFIIDVGCPAFMPTSRSGGRDREERQELVDRQILCMIEEYEENGQDIIVDRRRLLEAADLWGQRAALEELKVGARVRGHVCTLTDFGAFVDLGGIDGLVHVRDISWQYVQKPSDVLSLGQEVEALVVNVDAKDGRVALSLKALQPDPWKQLAGKYRAGDRVQGTVTTLNSVGAFVALEPGVEGLVHATELNARRPGTETIRAGTTTEFYITEVNTADRRIALSCRTAGEDPWQSVEQRFPVGSVISGTITSLTSFGAFVAVEGDLEGMMHVSDISESRTEHPRDVLRQGQLLRLKVLESDGARRRLRLGLKQLDDAERLQPVETQPPGVEPATDARMYADFTQYSRSVFINCSTHEPHRPVTEAIVFAVLDSGYIPRLAIDHAGLLAAVRECQFGIHDVSRGFELGLFLGCKEYGSDLHRVKGILLVTSAVRHEFLDEQVQVHANDPAEAIHHVGNWISKMTPLRRAGPQQVWERYQKFRKDFSALRARSSFGVGDGSIENYIKAVTEWVASHPDGMHANALRRRE